MLAKTKSNSKEALLSKAFINYFTIHDKFTSVHNVLREYDDMKERIKYLKTSTVHQRF